MYSTLLTSKKSYFFTANSLQTLYDVNTYLGSVSKRQAVCACYIVRCHSRGLHYISVEGSNDHDDDNEMVVVALKLRNFIHSFIHSFTVLPFLTSPRQYTRAFSPELAEIDCGQFTNILHAWTRQVMYVPSNIATRWRNVCTSQTTVTAWYHFTRTEGFDDDFM